MHAARFLLPRPLALALWLAALAASAGGNDLVRHSEPSGEMFTATCPFSAVPRWSFLPVEIEAENPGPRPANWRITSSTRDFSSGATLRSNAAFRARPVDISRASLLIPTGGLGSADRGGYTQFEAELAGGSGRGRGNANRNPLSGSSAVLMTAGASSELSFKGAAFQSSQAPSDWRAYCGFHSLYLTPPEWEAMAPAARSAIKHWIRGGGQLVRVSANPGEKLTGLDLPLTDPAGPGSALSRGRVTDIQSGGFINTNKDPTDWAVRATSGTAIGSWEKRDPAAFATPSAKVAAGLMLSVVVVFAVLVGPINVFMLAPARRRHRLFVTTPLISLAAGGLLVVAVVLSDGIGGKGQRYVWLESAPPGENTHYLVQHQQSRCGVMLTTGFEIPEDAFLAPMSLERGELSGDLSLELAPGKVMAGGPWFSSRRAQNFFLSAARPARGRIEKSGPDEQPVLTSAFEFPIERIFWLAADGKSWWQAGALVQGTATPLQPCTAEVVQQTLKEATARAPLEYARDLTTASLRPGCFLAMAKGITAIETHQRIRWQTHGFVTGPAVAP